LEVDYSGLIESLLNNLGVLYFRRDKYYICQNPMLKDEKPSFQIYENDGTCVSWNGLINGKEILSIKDVCIFTGNYNLYVEWACSQSKVPITAVNKYKETFNDVFIDKSKIGYLKQIIYPLTQAPFYISFTSLVTVGRGKIIRRKFESTQKKKESNIRIEDPNAEELKIGTEYLEKRKISTSDICSIKRIVINDFFKSVAICFTYPCGFVKIRFTSGSFKCLSKGSYQSLLKIRDNNTKRVIVIEGEIEGVSILEYTDMDIYAMHNKASLPKDISVLNKYDDITFLVDGDKYEDCVTILNNKLKNTKLNYSIRKKICNLEGVDYNDLLVGNKLNNNIVETGIFKRE